MLCLSTDKLQISFSFQSTFRNLGFITICIIHFFFSGIIYCDIWWAETVIMFYDHHKHYNIKYGVLWYHCIVYSTSCSSPENKFLQYCTVCTVSSLIYKYSSTIVCTVQVLLLVPRTSFYSTACTISSAIYKYSSTVVCTVQVVLVPRTLCTE